MIVLGVDTHKRTHALAAVEAGSGVVCGQRSITADESGHLAALRWARELDPERVWAIEDCRQAEGKTRREAILCLKRHLARRVWHLLQPDPETTIPTNTPNPPSRPITIHGNRPTGSPELT